MAGRGGRSTLQLIGDAFGVYRRYPVLFLALATVVIVPYELIVMAIFGPDLATDSDDALAGFVLGLVDLFLINSLVSALHVHGVADVLAGEEPRFGSIARRGLAALPVVAAATIMAFLGVVLGSVALVVPGVILWIRWLVVAQAAAIERRGWSAALRRSWALSEGNWLHVFGFLVLVTLMAGVPPYLLSLALGDPTVLSFFPKLALQVVAVSFAALATALLYFDLRTRRELLAAEHTVAADPAAGAPEDKTIPADRGYDPHAWSDAERPSGWFIDPDRPNRMLYWGGSDNPGWRGETRAPRKLRVRWEERA